MNQRNRAWRRLQDYRIGKKAFLKLKTTSFQYDSSETKDKENERVRKDIRYIKDNMANCSCHMCGNPSYPKLKNLSKQADNIEIKATENFKSQDY